MAIYPPGRAQIIQSLGAKDTVIQTLLEYHEADFDLSSLQTLGRLPLLSAFGFLIDMVLLNPFCQI